MITWVYHHYSSFSTIIKQLSTISTPWWTIIQPPIHHCLATINHHWTKQLAINSPSIKHEFTIHEPPIHHQFSIIEPSIAPPQIHPMVFCWPRIPRSRPYWPCRAGPLRGPYSCCWFSLQSLSSGWAQNAGGFPYYHAMIRLPEASRGKMMVG